MMKRWMYLALLCALLWTAAAAETGPVELSGWYGRSLAEAAAAVGGLAYAAGEEFPDNYEGGGLALRGDGVVRLIDLGADAGGYALCGVTPGMKRAAALDALAAYPQLWSYDEEVAWMIAADEADQLNSQMLVLFFDDDARVCGAWYRSN